MWRRKPERPAIDFALQLEMVPLRNAKVAREDVADGARLTVDLRHRGLAAALARPLRLRRNKSYVLQGAGLELFDAIDGRRTVGDLADGLAERHRLTFFESRALVVEYLSGLIRRGLVVVARVAPE